MQSLEQLKAQLSGAHAVNWDQLPDIALYMDQVISYMPRQLTGLHDDKLTPAMVNNYIKDKLLPRAEGKKYSRDHIAYLTAICLLKQVLPVKDIGILLGEVMACQDTQSFYAKLTQELDQSLAEASQSLDKELQEEDLWSMALKLAVSAYTQQLICKQLIQMLSEKGDRAAEES